MNLVHNARQMTLTVLKNFLVKWRSMFCAILRGHSDATIRKLHVPPDFLTPHIVHLYLQPLVLNAAPSILSWDTASDLRKLAAFAMQHITSSNTPAKLLKRFNTLVFPGIAIHQLIKTQLKADGMLDVDICPHGILCSLARPWGTIGNQCRLVNGKVYAHVNLNRTILFDIAVGIIDRDYMDDYQKLFPKPRWSKVWLSRTLHEFVLSKCRLLLLSCCWCSRRSK